MPYVSKIQRQLIESGQPPSNAGELNYCFTKLVVKYLDTKGTSYQTFNDIIGALECCKQEIYRRRIAQYEELKRGENGDVFG